MRDRFTRPEEGGAAGTWLTGDIPAMVVGWSEKGHEPVSVATQPFTQAVQKQNEDLKERRRDRRREKKERRRDRRRN